MSAREPYVIVPGEPRTELIQMFDVQGPDGVCGSTTYADEDDAAHEADILNGAYRAGYDMARRETLRLLAGIRDAARNTRDSMSRDELLRLSGDRDAEGGAS